MVVGGFQLANYKPPAAVLCCQNEPCHVSGQVSKDGPGLADLPGNRGVARDIHNEPRRFVDVFSPSDFFLAIWDEPAVYRKNCCDVHWSPAFLEVNFSGSLGHIFEDLNWLKLTYITVWTTDLLHLCFLGISFYQHQDWSLRTTEDFFRNSKNWSPQLFVFFCFCMLQFWMFFSWWNSWKRPARLTDFNQISQHTTQWSVRHVVTWAPWCHNFFPIWCDSKKRVETVQLVTWCNLSLILNHQKHRSHGSSSCSVRFFMFLWGAVPQLAAGFFESIAQNQLQPDVAWTETLNCEQVDGPCFVEFCLPFFLGRHKLYPVLAEQMGHEDC